MLKHFIYCRKSSEDDDRQALSIVAQLSELGAIREGGHLSVIDTFNESKSAKEPGRQVFNEMLRRIEAGEANAILTWKLDRLARNFDDGGRIIGMLQRGVIQEIRTFEKTYLPTDNVLLIAVELGMANQYVRDLSLNIRRGIREKIRRGIFYGKAPLGYYNEPRLRTIEPHPRDFKKVKVLFKRFATGEYSLTQIQREFAKAGLVGTRSGQPLPLSSIFNLLRKPFYYGVFNHKGELHQGVHVPMISKQTFEDVQKALIAVGKPRNGQRKEKGFFFLNFARCGSCGYAITAERKVKKSGLRFRYYRCTHKSKTQLCEDRLYTSERKLMAEVKRNSELVCLPDEWKEKFLARIETWSDDATETRQAAIDRLRGSLASVKSKLQRINNAFAEGTLDVDEFRELKNPLVPKKVEIEQQIIRLETTKHDRLEPLRNWILEANQANQCVAEENWSEMKSFLKRVGSNRLLRAQTLTVSWKSTWGNLAKTTLAVAATDSVSERTSLWWSLGGPFPFCEIQRKATRNVRKTFL
jgi:DNA invertase Pin-like site-specific DNA recombinase